MMEVENFTIFIKNSIRFPTFNYTKYENSVIDDNDDITEDVMHFDDDCLFECRGNFLSTITDDYIKKCNFDMINNTYCPIFRVGDVVRYAQQNFTKLADKVGLRDIFFFSLAAGHDNESDLYIPFKDMLTVGGFCGLHGILTVYLKRVTGNRVRGRVSDAQQRDPGRVKPGSAAEPPHMECPLYQLS